MIFFAKKKTSDRQIYQIGILFCQDVNNEIHYIKQNTGTLEKMEANNYLCNC